MPPPNTAKSQIQRKRILNPKISETSAKTSQEFHWMARRHLETIRLGTNTVTVPGSKIANKTEIDEVKRKAGSIIGNALAWAERQPAPSAEWAEGRVYHDDRKKG